MDDQQLFFKRLNRRTRFTQFLVWIALFFTAAGIAAGYKNWLRIHQKAKAGLAGIAEIREEMPSFAKKDQVLVLQKSIDGRLNHHIGQSNQTIKNLKQIELSTKHIANTIYQQVEDITKYQESITHPKQPAVAHDLSLSEIQFLLQTAIDVLALKQDKNTAIKALTLADQRLLKKGTAEFLPLRKQISLDIANLNQYVLADKSALSEKITALQNKLAAINKPSKEEIKTDSSKNSNKEESWLKKTISKAIVIQKFDQPLHDEINKETEKVLSQLLSLKLETLRMMLLQGHNKIYHRQVNNIQILIKQSYPKEIAVSYEKELNYLDSINLNPEIPDISASLKVFESIVPENR